MMLSRTDASIPVYTRHTHLPVRQRGRRDIAMFLLLPLQLLLLLLLSSLLMVVPAAGLFSQSRRANGGEHVAGCTISPVVCACLSVDTGAALLSSC